MYSNIIYTTLLMTAASAVAGDVVVNLWLPNADPQPLVAEVIGVKGSLTTYVVKCAKDTPSDECGMPDQGYTVAAGPSTFQALYNYNDYHMSAGCAAIANSASFDCSVSFYDATTTKADHMTLPAIGMPFFPVTVTATHIAAAATTKSSPSADTAIATATATATVTSTATASSTESSGTSGTSDTSNAMTTSASSTASSSGSASGSEQTEVNNNAGMAQVAGVVQAAAVALCLVLALTLA